MSNVIQVGKRFSFALMYRANGFGVYEKQPTNGQPPAYIIARLPSKKSPDATPASVTHPFEIMNAAIATLDQWVALGAVPKPPPKPRKLAQEAK